MTEDGAPVVCPPGVAAPRTPRPLPRGLGAGDEPGPETPVMDVLVGGAGIGLHRDDAGQHGRFATVGLFVGWSRGGAVGLTASHVARGDRVVAFHPRPPGDGPSRARAEIVRWWPDAGLALVAFADACVRCNAVWRPDGDVAVRAWATRDDVENLIARQASVTKCGRATGVTRGRVVDQWGGRLVIAGPRDSTLSAGGDSGALWLTDDGLAVGLHDSGWNEGPEPRAGAVPMPAVRDAMLRDAPSFV